MKIVTNNARAAGTSMIVCSCNVITDHDVRAAVKTVPHARPSTCKVYNCLGCGAQCGRCARTIRNIMDEAIAGAEASKA